MNYEQMYKEALERAKKTLTNEIVEDIFFSELKEPEDERTRKEIITYLSNDRNGVTQLTPRTNQYEKWIAWLEKQGEKNPTPDLRTWKYIVDYTLTRFIGVGQYLDNFLANTIAKDLHKKYSLEQTSVEWSEEDCHMLNRVIMTLSGFSYFGGMEASYVIDWLKSLKPQNRWKPSEEQMEALKYALGEGGHYSKSALESLYSDLQKL